jgi:hypothetical protein
LDDAITEARMLGALTWEELEDMTIPDLVSRIDSVRRVDARRRRDALNEATLAARGSPEQLSAAATTLGDAAGVQTDGDLSDLARDLGAL